MDQQISALNGEMKSKLRESIIMEKILGVYNCPSLE